MFLDEMCGATIHESLTPECSYHGLGVVFGQEWVILVGLPQLCGHKAHFRKTFLCADEHWKHLVCNLFFFLSTTRKEK